jgi:tetratricopeptide (TPR) repeat protein
MAFDDIAEAITHAVAHDQTSRRAYFLCGILWAIVHQYRAGDIVELGRSVMTRWPDDESPLAAQAIASLATAEYVTGHPDRAVSLAEGALARRPEPGPALIVLHRVLGQSTRALGDLERSEATFRAGAAIGHGVGLTAMALELDTAAALVGADRGDLERAMADIEEVVRRAEPIGSAITLSWAKTSLGWLLLRSDPSAALAIIEEALAEAQQIDYPVAVAVGLRSRAYAHLLSGDLPTAVSATSELLDDLLRRGALSNVRILFDVASAVAYRCGHPAWEQLAATTRSLPITTLAAAHDLVGLPATTAAPWPRLDAIAEVRHIIRELVGLALAAPVPAPAPAPAQPVRAATGRAWIAQLGDVWEFAFDRHTVAVRSAKGVIDIVRLIEAGGSEMHCLDLAEAGVEQASVGEVIDAKARRTYEQRIRDLQDDINEAEANSDYERSYRQQVELDALIEHLAAALGHGNRARRSTDTAERARSAVAHRVRITISRIGKLHPTLGRHLAHSVNTGIYCSYRPEQPTQWEIRRS